MENTPNYEQPELISEREVLEGLSVNELLSYKAFLHEKISDAERSVNLVNDILDGYGYEGDL